MKPDDATSVPPRFGIQESFEVIEQPSEQRFSDRFYETMFSRFPELKDKFTGVILAHQGALLMSALGVIAQSNGKVRPSVAEYLKVLGHRHHHRGIDADDYAKFEAALLETLESYLGNRWTDDLERQWQNAIQSATEMMLLGHRDGQVIY